MGIGFRVKAGSATIAVVPVCHEVGSTRVWQLMLCFYATRVKKVLEMISLRLTDTHRTWQRRSLHVEVLLVKLKTLYSEGLLSHRLQCEDYCYVLSPVTCPTSKSSTGSDLAGERGGNSFLFIFDTKNKTLCIQRIKLNTFVTQMVSRSSWPIGVISCVSKEVGLIILMRFYALSQNCKRRLLASSCQSIRSSVRLSVFPPTEELDYHWTNSHEIWYLSRKFKFD